MTWKMGEQKDVENIDNYIAAIDSAKEELNKLNADILTLSAQRDEIISTNHELLKEKLEKIEHDRRNVELSQKILDEVKARQDEASKVLDLNFKITLDGQEKLNNDKASFLSTISNKNKEIEDREKELVKSVSNFNANQEAFNKTAQENADVLLKITEVKNIAAKSLEEAIEQRKSSKENLDAISDKVEEWKGLKLQVQLLKEEIKEKSEQAIKDLEESRINKRLSDDNLKAVLKEKEELKELIIENKRTNLESTKSSESLTNIIANANQKLAELKELKEAMAKKEN